VVPVNEQVQTDLRSIFSAFSLECLGHLRDNAHRLTRRAYRLQDGRGCVMYLLSEPLPEEMRIDSKIALMRFFGPAYGSEESIAESPDYQPARWIVRLWDEQDCQGRYGNCRHLSRSALLAVLEEVMAERQEIEREAARQEEKALSRLG